MIDGSVGNVSLDWWFWGGDERMRVMLLAVMMMMVVFDHPFQTFVDDYLNTPSPPLNSHCPFLCTLRTTMIVTHFSSIAKRVVEAALSRRMAVSPNILPPPSLVTMDYFLHPVVVRCCEPPGRRNSIRQRDFLFLVTSSSL